MIGNKSYGRRQIQTKNEAHMLYLIKLTHQKDAYLILTRKCFTIVTNLSSEEETGLKKKEPGEFT